MCFTRKINLPLTFRAFQLLYASRIIWWGIGAKFGLHFSLPYLNFLKTPPWGHLLIATAICGFIAAIRKNFFFSYLFHLVATFVFGIVTYSFFLNDPSSVAGGSYFLDTMGLIWLTIRIRQYDTIK